MTEISNAACEMCGEDLATHAPVCVGYLGGLEEQVRCLREAILDLLDRQYDHPTDLSGPFANHEWQAAFERARQLLDMAA